MHPLQQALAVVKIARHGGLYDLVDVAAKGITRHIRKGQLKTAQEKASFDAWKEKAEREGTVDQALYPEGMQGGVSMADAIKSMAAKDIGDLQGKSGLQVTPGLSAGLRGEKPPLQVGVPGGVPQLQMDPAIGEEINPILEKAPEWTGRGFGWGLKFPMPGYAYGPPTAPLPTAQQVTDFARGPAVETPTALPPAAQPTGLARQPLQQPFRYNPNALPDVPGVPQTQLTPPQQAVPFTLGQEEGAAAIPQIAPTPGIVHSGGPKPAAPQQPIQRPPILPVGSEGRRYHESARRRVEQRLADKGDVIPQDAELLKMTLEEIRQVVKFGLSSNPTLRTAQIRRVARAASLIGKVERTPGLMGTIAGKTGGDVGRKYALELATADKAESELDIANKLALIDRRSIRKRRRGGRDRSRLPKSMLAYNFFNKTTNRYETKMGSEVYWTDKAYKEERAESKGEGDTSGGRTPKQNWERKFRRIRKTRKGQKQIASANRHTLLQNRLLSGKAKGTRGMTGYQKAKSSKAARDARAKAETAADNIGGAKNIDTIDGRKAIVDAANTKIKALRTREQKADNTKGMHRQAAALRGRIKRLKGDRDRVNSYRPPSQATTPTSPAQGATVGTPAPAKKTNNVDRSTAAVRARAAARKARGN
tara:strand:+ start:3310 stop:5256 length:1947 start_codon:yes stop_codon:yes gene_type:complete